MIPPIHTLNTHMLPYMHRGIQAPRYKGRRFSVVFNDVSSLSLEVYLTCICRKEKEGMRGRVGLRRANLSNEINSMLINDCSFILSYLKVASRNILGL